MPVMDQLTLGLIITLIGHLAVTVWWASRMDTNVKHLVQSVDTLVRQGESHSAVIAEHGTRIAVVETQVAVLQAAEA